MKKLLSLSLAIITAVTFFCANLYITPTTYAAEEKDSTHPLLTTLTSKQVTEQYPEITQEIVEGLTSLSTDISIDNELKISEDYIEDIYSSILCENPQLFYVSSLVVDVSSKNPEGTLFSLRPTYIFDIEEIPDIITQFEQRADYFLSNIDENASDFCKCRCLHDLIALNCKYCQSEDNGASTPYVYTAYGAIVAGEAYCEGYTLAYNYLLDRLGINNEYVQSLEVNHAWSLVEIDGDYYHVDIAYDDPTPDTLGRVFHDYCIVSDGQMNAYDSDENNSFKHTGWVSTISADNNQYNTDWWRGVETAIYTIGDYDYYIDHTYSASLYGGLMAHNNTTDEETELVQIETRWYVDGKTNIYWQGNFSYLYYDGEYLYYNDTQNVCKYDITSSQASLYYTKPDTISYYIYGFTGFVDDKMYISAKASPNDEDIIYEIENNVSSGGDGSDSGDPMDSTSATEPTTSSGSSSSGTITITPDVEIPEYTYSKKLSVGKTYTLSISDVAENSTLSYTSSKPSVVKVLNNGKIAALKKGKSTVTMTIKQDSQTVGIVKCKITVSKDPTLSKKTVTVKKGKKATVKINGKVSSINNKYTNTKYAKITSSTSAKTLKVKGLKKGKTTLKVKVNGVKTLKLTVKVK